MSHVDTMTIIVLMHVNENVIWAANNYSTRRAVQATSIRTFSSDDDAAAVAMAFKK